MERQVQPSTSRTRVRRHPERGVYDRAALEAILDEALIAHVGMVDDGAPFIIPTMYVRDGEHLYLHGSRAARWIRLAVDGAELCVAVTLLDGLVLARSAFHHSMNYRSVIMYGQATLVEDREEQLHASARLVDHVVRERSRETRAPHQKELDATAILSMNIAEASVKMRTGGPVDAAEDASFPAWAGVIPVHMAFEAPLADATIPPIVEPSPHVRTYRRGAG
jgi:nitroimidazol reductase NimA-like FMN-containing flavoprotein (pyridoxamine 5'-phosphate oxidase superfamily)